MRRLIAPNINVLTMTSRSLLKCWTRPIPIRPAASWIELMKIGAKI